MNERLGTLNRITEITNSHCLDCPVNSNKNLNECEPCPHFKELNNLGERLMTISRIKRNNKYDLAISDRKREKEKTSAVKSLIDLDEYREMTVENYFYLKNNRYADWNIAKIWGVSESLLRDFKNRTNINDESKRIIPYVKPQRGKVPHERKQEVIERLKKGERPAEIARALKIGVSMIYKTKAKLKQA